MSEFLKFLSPLLHPVGLAWLVLVAAGGISLRRRRWTGALACGFSAIGLWILGQPRLMHPIYRELERPYSQSTVEHAPAADAIIVLGGGWHVSRPDYRHLDFTDNSDRFFAGVELARLGRAKVLVFGGDPFRHPSDLATNSTELGRWSRDWGLGSIETLSLGPVINTHDEAVSAARLVRERGWKKVLLVTSAYHMRRSLATFAREGVPAHPVACDFRFLRDDPEDDLWRAGPKEEDLFHLTLWWHETVGSLGYRLLGRN